jgi:hypothetical protein
MRRSSVIFPEAVAAIVARFAHVLPLAIGVLEVMIAFGDAFPFAGDSDHAARPVERDADTAGHHHGGVREDRESGALDTDQDRGVIPENAAGPFSSDETLAVVAEAVVDPAVEADVRPPVSGMKHVGGAFKAPVGRRPQ